MTFAGRDIDVSHIQGNAPDYAKKVVGDPLGLFHYWNRQAGREGRRFFGDKISDRLVATEVSVLNKAEEPLKEEARVVFTLVVEPDMINGMGIIHGGCLAFLIDICTSLTFLLLPLMKTGKHTLNVSSSLNTSFHSPAALGDELRIVCTTMALGARTVSARAEVWDVTAHRLIASGVHTKMEASVLAARL
ncbi:HotDog domain-containing protein [Mycena floridula]|nr:HotDog domain-containing protein [Mycena floridula]